VQTTSSSDSKVVIANSNTPGSGALRLEFQYGTGTIEGTNRYRFGYVEGYRQGGSNDGGLIFGTKPSNAAAPTERLRIKSDGKIGINNNNPTHPLHIVNTSSTFNSASLIKGDTSTSGGGAYVTFTNTADSKSAYFGVDGNGLFNINAGAALVGTNGDESIIFCTNGNSQKARITSNGLIETASNLE